MKRLSEKQRKAWIRTSREREKRAQRSSDRRRELRRLGLTYHSAERRLSVAKPRITIKAPSNLSLRDEHYADTIDFFEAAREAAFVQERRIVLDLRDCLTLSAEMTLLLAAEVQRIRAVRGKGFVTGLSPHNDQARGQLHSMGVFKAVDMVDPFSVNKGDDQTAIYTIKSGTTLDGKITKQFADDFGIALDLDADTTETVQKAFNEALENISEHAYYDREAIKWPAEPGRWWICAVTSASKHGAYLLACDLGMTIPATVPETARKRGPANLAALADYLAANIGKSTDERLLGAAFEDGVTRRPGGKGGRGLGKMASLVQEFPKGHLQVWSGEAHATVRKGAADVKVKKLPRPFAGTYVLWHLAQEDTML